jgi:hypothetical protein
MKILFKYFIIKIFFYLYGLMGDIYCTTCDIHDQKWLADILLSYSPGLGRHVCDYISSFLVVRYNSDINERKWISVHDTHTNSIECSSLCPYFPKFKCKFKKKYNSF